MANYPTSNPSFPTRSAGQTITAAFFNDPQDEIVAIGTDLRTGLNHSVTLNSTHSLNVTSGNSTLGGTLHVAGNSTLASALHVGGNSTLAGNLQVTGTSTFTGAVTFNGGQTFGGVITASSGVTVSTGLVRQNSLPAFSVYSSAVQTFASGAANGFNFDVQDFVRGSVEHSTATNSSRVTINSTGMWDFDVTALVNQGAGGLRPRCYISLNDGTSTLAEHTMSFAATTDETLAFGAKVRVASSGYLTVRYVSSNANSTVGATTMHNAIRFMGHFLG